MCFTHFSCKKMPRFGIFLTSNSQGTLFMAGVCPDLTAVNMGTWRCFTASLRSTVVKMKWDPSCEKSLFKKKVLVISGREDVFDHADLQTISPSIPNSFGCHEVWNCGECVGGSLSCEVREPVRKRRWEAKTQLCGEKCHLKPSSATGWWVPFWYK